MNKKMIFIFILMGLALFCAGSLVGATANNWMDQISIDSANQIGGAGKAKADELTINLQANIESSVKERVKPIVDTKKQEVEDELQAYFESKITTITESQQYKDVIADLERIKTNELARYKAQIDKAFAGQ